MEGFIIRNCNSAISRTEIWDSEVHRRAETLSRANPGNSIPTHRYRQHHAPPGEVTAEHVLKEQSGYHCVRQAIITHIPHDRMPWSPRPPFGAEGILRAFPYREGSI